MINEIIQCTNCGYNEFGIIKDIANPSFYRIITNRYLPKLIFVLFDLLNEYDKGAQLKLDLLEYQRRIQYNKDIINILNGNINFDSIILELKGIIFTPTLIILLL